MSLRPPTWDLEQHKMGLGCLLWLAFGHYGVLVFLPVYQYLAPLGQPQTPISQHQAHAGQL